jgi:uroporphyrinogen decarboxylase
VTEDQRRAMEFRNPEHIPVSVSILPAAWMKYREKMEAVTARHPLLFGNPEGKRDFDAVWTPTYAEGEHVDAWGCVWSNVHRGREAIVTGHPLPTRESVRGMKAPAVDAGLPHGFMFLRLMDLRGFEELMLDFAEEPPELEKLIGTVLEYNLGQVDRLLASKPGDMAVFGDDLGMQAALPISPAKWRKYLKPCYAAIFGRVRKAGLPVYFHSDGHIHEIIPDLVECGVTVINPQSRANGLDNLAKVCRGKVCVDLDLDRQMFPFCTPAEVDAHVREAVEKLGSPAGGLWLKAEVADDVPLPVVEAICLALEKYRGYFRGPSGA